MKGTFDEVIDHLLQNEGGYVNHSEDPGGHTNKGITFATLRSYYGQHVSINDLKNLTDDQAKAIYRAKYWDEVSGDDLPPGLDYTLFDFAVNSGPGRASQFLQQRIGARMDGIIGPKTLAALKGVVIDRNSLISMIRTLNDDRLGWLETLDTWDTFGKGWTSRIVSVETKSITIVNAEVPQMESANPTKEALNDIINRLNKLMETM